jgi:hypothetical protein
MVPVAQRQQAEQQVRRGCTVAKGFVAVGYWHALMPPVERL